MLKLKWRKLSSCLSIELPSFLSISLILKPCSNKTIPNFDSFFLDVGRAFIGKWGLEPEPISQNRCHFFISHGYNTNCIVEGLEGLEANDHKIPLDAGKELR
jgi:hypothetical protein